MTTRLYLGGNVSGDVSVPPDAGWDVLGPDAGFQAAAVRAYNGGIGFPLSAELSADVVDVLCGKFVTAPLQARDIAGSIKGSICCNQIGDYDLCAQLLMKVVSGDGQTVRGILVPFVTDPLSSEFYVAGIFGRTRRFPRGWVDPGQAVSPVTAQAGDRIAIEVGFRAYNTVATSCAAYIWFVASGTQADSSEAEDGPLGGAWLEFSQTLLFLGDSGPAAAWPSPSTAPRGWPSTKSGSQAWPG